MCQLETGSSVVSLADDLLGSAVANGKIKISIGGLNEHAVWYIDASAVNWTETVLPEPIKIQSPPVPR